MSWDNGIFPPWRWTRLLFWASAFRVILGSWTALPSEPCESLCPFRSVGAWWHHDIEVLIVDLQNHCWEFVCCLNLPYLLDSRDCPLFVSLFLSLCLSLSFPPLCNAYTHCLSCRRATFLDSVQGTHMLRPSAPSSVSAFQGIPPGKWLRRGTIPPNKVHTACPPPWRLNQLDRVAEASCLAIKRQSHPWLSQWCQCPDAVGQDAS